MSPDIWQRGCDQLATELPEQQFNTWIRPLPAADIVDEDGPQAIIDAAVARLDGIISNFLEAIRPRPPDLAETDLSLLAADGLHYSEKSYAYWAKELATKIQESIHQKGK
ncbi:MAG: DnaA N-terminal domain-containing protein [Chlorobium sp.]